MVEGEEQGKATLNVDEVFKITRAVLKQLHSTRRRMCGNIVYGRRCCLWQSPLRQLHDAAAATVVVASRAPVLAGVGNRSPRQPKLQHQPPAIKPTATPPPARPTPESDTQSLPKPQLRTSHDGRHLLRSASARWPRLLVQEYPHSCPLWREAARLLPVSQV